METVTVTKSKAMEVNMRERHEYDELRASPGDRNPKYLSFPILLLQSYPAPLPLFSDDDGTPWRMSFYSRPRLRLESIGVPRSVLGMVG